MEQLEKSKEQLMIELEQLRRKIEGLEGRDACPESLKQQQEKLGSRFQQIVVLSPNPITTLDSHGRIVFWNDACRHLTGYSSTEVAGLDFGTLLLDAENRDVLERVVQDVFSGKSVVGQEMSIRSKSGGVRRTLCRAYAVRDSEGAIEQCVLANVDITELKSAEQALRDSEERYRALAESSFEGIIIANEDGVILEANQNFADLTGYGVSQLPGMTVDEVTAKEYRDLALERLSSEDGRSFELVGLRKDGSTGAVEVRGKRIPYKGSPARVISVVDVTERKRAEQALRQNAERLQAIFEAAQDCIFVKDKDRKFIHVNSAMSNLLGRPLSELLGLATDDIFDTKASQRIREVDARVLQGESVEEEHTRIIKGDELTFLDITVPLMDSNGEITGICGIWHNITERKKALPVPWHSPSDYPSEAMRITMKRAHQAASREGIVLLLGESGSGKDHLARWIHEHSGRASGPFFAINCAALPTDLAESELFGHEAGAFTGAHRRKKGLLELAEGGTLLLNEIGELSQLLQAKLLTFLDTRAFLRVGGEKSIHVDARIIAATHRNLETEVSEGRFLQPLLYRLNVFSITVPPLRERIADLPLLIERLLPGMSSDLGLSGVAGPDAASIAVLSRYNWPGNVRELRNVIERALMLWDDGPLNLELTLRELKYTDWSYPVRFSSGDVRLHDITVDFRKSVCLEAIRRCGHNKKEAARSLGISRDSLYRYTSQTEEGEPD
jgi:PAS domain S-box-containing protein